jgi:hypothetical protein
MVQEKRLFADRWVSTYYSGGGVLEDAEGGMNGFFLSIIVDPSL